MESLAKVLVSLREKKSGTPQVIKLPVAMERKEAMHKSSFHHYMRLTHNIICL